MEVIPLCLLLNKLRLVSLNKIEINSIQIFSFLWPCIVSKLWSEIENQPDATVRCLLSILPQHFSVIIMPIFRRTRRVLLHVVCCAVTSGEKVDISCNVFFLWKTHEAYTSPTPRHTHLHTTFAYTHEVPSRFTAHYPTKKTLQLISTFSPLVTAQHTTCSNTRLGLLKMGKMMPETCWESIDNKHLTVASCWFSISLLNSNCCILYALTVSNCT